MQIHIPKRKAKYFNYIEIRIRIESIKKISKPHLLLNGLLFIEKTNQILRVLKTILEKFLKSNISCFDGERERAEVKAKRGLRLLHRLSKPSIEMLLPKTLLLQTSIDLATLNFSS